VWGGGNDTLAPSILYWGWSQRLCKIR